MHNKLISGNFNLLLSSSLHNFFILNQNAQRDFINFNKIFLKDRTDFWINDGIQQATFKDGYAGYKQWNGLEKEWTPKLSLLEGITGIGLVIIDYLSDEVNSWDECSIIS